MAPRKKRFRKKSQKTSQKLGSLLARIIAYTGIAVMAVFLLLLPGQNVYFRLSFAAKPPLEAMWPPIPPAAPLPVQVTNQLPDALTANGVYVEDIASGVVLFARNADVRRPPASTTKMMTALVALETLGPEHIATVNTTVTEGRVMGLVPGEQITVENLLYGTLVHSGNDAAYTLAENFPGGVEAFVSAMNEKARMLNLEQTHFTNAVGFDDATHMSTPRDLARLAKSMLANPVLSKMVGIPEITVSDVDFTTFHSLRNVNELVGRVPGVAGVKSGFTQNAGESLVSLAQRDGHSVLIVLLNSQDRFAESEQLINWVFDNHRWEAVVPLQGGATAGT